eukprot:208622-Rhodomonas_salina.1
MAGLDSLKSKPRYHRRRAKCCKRTRAPAFDIGVRDSRLDPTMPFSLRLRESSLEHIPKLFAIFSPPEDVKQSARRLRCVSWLCAGIELKMVAVLSGPEAAHAMSGPIDEEDKEEEEDRRRPRWQLEHSRCESMVHVWRRFAMHCAPPDGTTALSMPGITCSELRPIVPAVIGFWLTSSRLSCVQNLSSWRICSSWSDGMCAEFRFKSVSPVLSWEPYNPCQY